VSGLSQTTYVMSGLARPWSLRWCEPVGTMWGGSHVSTDVAIPDPHKSGRFSAISARPLRERRAGTV